MENESEMIRQQMDETRAALTDKIETLEHQVVDTVQAASTAVSETVGSVKEIVHDSLQTVKDSVHDTVETVKDTFDLHRQVDRRPWTMFAGAPHKVHVLGCPGHDEADRLALEMFRQLLDPSRWDVEVLSIEMLSAEMVALAGQKRPAVVCIAAMPPGGLAHTRYLCKRLRAQLPDAKIVVGRWGLTSDLEQNQEQLREAGADQVEMNLRETCNHLNSWLPVLTQEGGIPPQKIAG